MATNSVRELISNRTFVQQWLSLSIQSSTEANNINERCKQNITAKKRFERWTNLYATTLNLVSPGFGQPKHETKHNIDA